MGRSQQEWGTPSAAIGLVTLLGVGYVPTGVIAAGVVAYFLWRARGE
ncbi:hypothetical protein [Candidatus Palauibacter sp.]